MSDDATERLLARVGEITLTVIALAAAAAAAIFIGPAETVFTFLDTYVGDMHIYFQGPGGAMIAGFLNGAIFGIGLGIAAFPWFLMGLFAFSIVSGLRGR